MAPRVVVFTGMTDKPTGRSRGVPESRTFHSGEATRLSLRGAHGATWQPCLCVPALRAGKGKSLCVLRKLPLPYASVSPTPATPHNPSVVTTTHAGIG